MMKKLSKLFTVLLALLFIIGSLTVVCSCANTPNDEPNFDNATEIKVMSFNIRVGEQTSLRRAAVIKNIKDVNPDTLGVQEADPAWITYLSTELSDYTLVGEGRDGGKEGEYAAIFYRTEKFNLIQGGTKWLSLSPNTPSILDGGSQYKRVMTYAKLEDKQSGSIFVHINAHLDYSSDEIARQQASIILEYAKIFKNYPTFITGDFNQNPESKTYECMSLGGFLDSSLEAQTANRVNTYTGYSTNESKHDLIDFCFISPKNIQINKYDTCNYSAENGGHEGYISDHYAIYVESKILNLEDASLEHEILNNTIFQCGNNFYGDVSFNFDSIAGVSCQYYDRLICITVSNGKSITFDGIKTTSNIGVEISGEGEIVINGDITTNSFTTTNSITVTVNGKINTSNTNLGTNTTVNR